MASPQVMYVHEEGKWRIDFDSKEGRKITLNSQQQFLFFCDRKLKPKLLKSQEVAPVTCDLKSIG